MINPTETAKRLGIDTTPTQRAEMLFEQTGVRVLQGKIVPGRTSVAGISNRIHKMFRSIKPKEKSDGSGS